MDVSVNLRAVTRARHPFSSLPFSSVLLSFLVHSARFLAPLSIPLHSLLFLYFFFVMLFLPITSHSFNPTEILSLSSNIPLCSFPLFSPFSTFIPSCHIINFFSSYPFHKKVIIYHSFAIFPSLPLVLFTSFPFLVVFSFL